MKVIVTSKPIDCNLPTFALLKLFDRRYLEERMDVDDELSWNYDRELLVARVSDEVMKHRKEIPKPVIHKFIPEEAEIINPDEAVFVDDDLDEVELEATKNLDEKLVKQYKMEKLYRDEMMSWFKTESRAYFQLQKLQSRCVPEFYGTTTFDLDSDMPAGILTEVSGILIQFIDGITLDKLEASSPTATSYPHIGQAVVNCLRRIALHGVLHGDIRLQNFIVRNDGRVFVFDFGLAMLREEGVSDEKWKEAVTAMQEESIVKILLDETELRDKTPREPFATPSHGYHTFNRQVESSRTSWVHKYYESINESHGFEYRINDNGAKYMYCLPTWRVKQDAATERRNYLESLDDWGLTLDSEKQGR